MTDGDDDRLGDLLVAAGRLTPSRRAELVALARRDGVDLAAALVDTATLRRAEVYRALAQMWGAPYLDLSARAVDPRVLDGLDPRVLARDGWVPVAGTRSGRHGLGEVVVATSREPTPRRALAIERVLGAPVALHVSSDHDVLDAVQSAFRDAVVDEAALGLWRRDPTRSARTVLDRRQRVVGAVAALLYVAALVLAPRGTLVATLAAVSVAFLVCVLFKFVVCMVGVRRENHVVVSAEEVAALDPAGLPRYTVLVPVFREANIVGRLIDNLGALDYPGAKLEILLLLEESDTETIAAARAADPPEHLHFVIVPPGGPQTKPRACNVGLLRARGEHLVIYDAEDVPEPDQLKKAVVAFRRGGERLVCVQAALNYWNADDNWLTRMFTTEYSFWFDYMLPGLDRLRLPIPLGGTSNHFRTDALRELGGWDPYNVTEDADLGIRAAALGRSVGVINSTTFEEANRAPGNWVRQRSRWIKGYLQTLLVHLRHPARLVATAGLRRTAAFALLIGGTPLVFLATPPLYALFVASLLLPPTTLDGLFPGPVLAVSLVNLLVGNGLMIYVSMMGAFSRQRYALVPWALLNPLYWVLHAVAAYKAVAQLVTKPHYWEKTQHGLSDAPPAAGPTQAPAR